jgi:Holliday junction resolvase RusA-like endonuclease
MRSAPDSSAGDRPPKSIVDGVTIVVEGTPIAQPRPRVFRGGGVATDNKRSKAWKDLIRYSFPPGPRPFIASAPVFLRLRFHFKRPKTGPNRSATWKTSKPDIDNLEKCALDALNGFAWTDDDQVVHIDAQKHYSNWSGVEIFFREL